MRKIAGIFSVALLAALGVFLVGTQGSSSAEVGSPLDTSGLPVEVTLITGHVVTVDYYETENPEYSVTLGGNGSGTAYSIQGNGHDTYVIPTGHGSSKLDKSLFNVDYLIEESYHQRDSLPVIITVADAPMLSDVKRIVRRLGGRVTFESTFLSMLAVDLPYIKLLEIDSSIWDNDSIKKVWLDKIVRPNLNISVPMIGAPSVWEQGLRGEGVIVAILDTGIDETHPDLDDLDGDPETDDPKVLFARDFTTDGTTEDVQGHGTHVSGITAGTGDIQGVAPHAFLWNIRVLNSAGSGQTSWIVAGIEYAALGADGEPNTDDEADVMNMSLGANINGDGTDPMSVAVDLATTNGVLVAIAAGNSGPGMGSVGTPGVAQKAITVGATDDNDSMAGFSSRGPTLDLRLKPDLSAPGVDIMSTRSGGGHVSFSGTSMATPHVAGAAALVMQAHPDWDPLMVKSALMNTSLILDGPRLWDQGAGRMRVYEAVNTNLVAVQPSYSFGELTRGHHITADLTVHNIGDVAVDVDLSVFTTIDGIGSSDVVSISPATLNISSGGSATAVLTVLVADHLPGWYEGRVTISGDDTNLTVPYLMKLSQSPIISVTPLSVDEVITYGEAPIKIIEIANIGLADLTYSMSSDADWICIPPDGSGNVPARSEANIEVVLNCGRTLDLDTYDGEIVIESNDQSNSPIVISVALEVLEGQPPEIDVNPDSFDVTLGLEQVSGQDLQIGNAGPGVLTFNIDAIDLNTGVTPTWITIGHEDDPVTRYVEPGDVLAVQITFDAGALGVGVYTAELTITSNDEDEGTVVVYAAMTVREPDIVVDPSSFEIRLDMDSVSSADLTITNSGDGPLMFEILTREVDALVQSEEETDFLIVSHNLDKSAFDGHEFDTISDSAFASYPLADMVDYKVVYFEPAWGSYDNLRANMDTLRQYVEQGGVAVINIAGNSGNQNDIDPIGTDYDRSNPHDSENILLPEHPYITGEPYDGDVLTESDFDSWNQTDHGWLENFPADSEVVIENADGASWIQYSLGRGEVIVTTLTYGWGGGGARGNPITNLVEYSLVPASAWILVDPLEGTVLPGGSLIATLHLDTGGLSPGTKYAEVVISSNDPDEDPTVVPVTLVLPTPAIVVSPLTIDLGMMDRNECNVGNINISNIGDGRLTFEIVGEGSGSLTANPASGQVAPDFGLAVALTVCAVDLDPGAHQINAVIHTNDPDDQQVTVVVHFGVHAPDIAVYPLEIDLGVMARNSCAVEDLAITNSSELGTLVFEFFRNQGPGSVTPNPEDGEVSPGGYQAVTLTICADDVDPGAHVIDYFVRSNDPMDPDFRVPIAFTVLAPEIEVEPSAVVVDADRNQVVTADLTITNTGDGVLVFDITLVETLIDGVNYIAPLLSGGPDSFGYRFSDSDEPSGPTFDWIDISSTGTPIGAGDDNQYSFPIGFDFEFYGNMYATVYVGTNGILGFSGASMAAYQNTDIPDPGTPNNLIAPFWDDLIVTSETKLLYEVIGEAPNRKLVVEWFGVRAYNNPDTSYTFEVILHENRGNILVQYLEMRGDLNSATMGIENSTGDDGLSVAFNEPYVNDNLAVLFAAHKPYLSVSPVTGTVNPGESLDLILEFDTNDLLSGHHVTDIVINNNDEDENPTVVRATLIITPPDIGIAPLEINLGALDRDACATGDVVITNSGDGSLVFEIGFDAAGNVTADPADGEIPVDSSVTVTLTGCATELDPGVYQINALINSNDPDSPQLIVPVNFTVDAPEISVDPMAVQIALAQDAQGSTDLIISNAGDGTLIFDISTEVQAQYGSLEATTEFLIVDHGRDKSAFAGHEFDTINDSAFASYPLADMLDYEVVYFEPAWGSYDNLRANMDTLRQYVEQGGVAVINIAGNSGNQNDIDPIGTDYDRSNPHDSGTILLPEHSYITGEPYDGDVLTESDFNNWNSTDHGWLENFPADSEVVIENADGASWIQYSLGRGEVIVTTLTYGWGRGGAHGNPITNLVEYSVALPLGLSWISVYPSDGRVPPGESLTVTVDFNSQDLDPNPYLANLVISNNDADESPTVIPATLVVLDPLPPNIGVDPLAIDLGILDREACSTADLTITNTGDGTLTFEITGNGSGDLVADPMSGIVASGDYVAVVLTVCAQDVDPGIRQINAVINSNDPDNAEITVPVVFTVPAPDISVSPSELSIVLEQDRVGTADLTIVNSGEGSLAFDVGVQHQILVTNGMNLENLAAAILENSWLTVSPISGLVTPGSSGTIVANVDTVGLDPGTYVAEILITHNDPSENTVQIPVTLVVPSPLPPDIGVSPLEISLGILDRDACSTADLTISNTGDGSLIFEIDGEGSGDLMANPAFGSVLPDSHIVVTLTICATDVNPGNRVFHVWVNSNDENQPRVIVPASFTVPSPDVHVSPGSFEITLERDMVSSADLTISNTGDGTLTFQITIQEGVVPTKLEVTTEEDFWLVVDPSVGRVAPNESSVVTLNVDTNDLDPGAYLADIVLYNNDLDENPIRIPVTLNVLEPPMPDIEISPVEFDLGVVDRDACSTADLTISNTGDATLTFDISTRGSGDLTVSPTNGSVEPGGSVAIFMAMCASDLNPGEYLMNVVIDTNDPDEPQVMVPVVFTVPAPDIVVNPVNIDVMLDRDMVISADLVVSNNGVGTLIFQTLEDIDWLTVEPAGGVVRPDKSVGLVVTVDSNGLEPGTYTGRILIESNDPEQGAIIVPVRIHVSVAVIRGRVTLQGQESHGKIKIAIVGPDTMLVETDGEGNFSVILHAGEYVVRAAHSYHLSAQMTLTLDVGQEKILTAKLFAGDLNNDGVVNARDLVVTGKNMGKTQSGWQ